MKRNKKDLQLFYLSGSSFPSNFANSVQVISQCNGFASMGIKVHLFGILSRNAKISDVFDAYSANSSIQFHLMNYSKIKSYFNIFFYFFWVSNNLKSNIEILYVRHINLFLMICIFKRFRNTKVVLELHHPISKFKYKLIYALSFLCKKIKIVYISTSLRNIQRKKVKFSSKIQDVIAHDACVPLNNSFTFNRKVNSVGYVGGFYKGRGLDTIINLANDLPEYTFHLVGGSREKLIQLYNLDVPLNVICYGYVDNSSISEYFNKFDICLALYDFGTSVPGGRNTVEFMSPLKIFEYMSMGKYIIASKLPVIEEILSDKINSCLVNFKDRSQIVNSIRRYKDTNFASKIMRRAFEDSKSHSWTNRAKIVLSEI
jgi:glycosyltransferase involved in cell wall biosynthesis